MLLFSSKQVSSLLRREQIHGDVEQSVWGQSVADLWRQLSQAETVQFKNTKALEGPYWCVCTSEQDSKEERARLFPVVPSGTTWGM